MKFLVDVCIGSYVENKLLGSLPNHDFMLVRDIDPRMKDYKIKGIASSEDRIIITADKDFGELIFKNKAFHAGILLVRIDELSLDERVSILIKLIVQFADLLKGKFGVYQGDKLRIR